MKKRFSGPQIVAKLRQADVLIGQGKRFLNSVKIPKSLGPVLPVYEHQASTGRAPNLDVASNWQGVANHTNPESCGDVRKDIVKARV